jgi:hypothetical protein
VTLSAATDGAETGAMNAIAAAKVSTHRLRALGKRLAMMLDLLC